MQKKVVKFGGTSMATADSVRRVRDIVSSDDSREIVVVSAPGKRFKGDQKVTDLLYKAYEQNKKKQPMTALDEVKERFVGLRKELGLNTDVEREFCEIARGIEDSIAPDYAASRGEYLAAKMFSEYSGYEFVDAYDLIAFHGAAYDPTATAVKCAEVLSGKRNIVVPGFFGADENGMVRTFSRGGSDVTGAILAANVGADLYENWTDVSGFMVADPHVVEGAKTMEILNYEELRELSYMGAGVLHPDSVFPVRASGIPINIRNTFKPEDSGTMIVPSYAGSPDRIVTGIAGHKHNTTIVVAKAMLNNEIGTVRKMLSVLEENGVSFEHLPTGIDTMSLVISDAYLTHLDVADIVRDIDRLIHPDKITVIKNLTLIAVVGVGISECVGCAARIFSSLAKINVNIRMIDMGSSAMNIILGVEDEDYVRAVNAIYDEFFQPSTESDRN